MNLNLFEITLLQINALKILMTKQEQATILRICSAFEL